MDFVWKAPIDTVNITPISSCSVTSPSIRSYPAQKCASLLWRGRGCQEVDLPLTIVSGTDFSFRGSCRGEPGTDILHIQVYGWMSQPRRMTFRPLAGKSIYGPPGMAPICNSADEFLVDSWGGNRRRVNELGPN